MLKYREVNPLAVFGLREIDHCPPHFTKVAFGSSRAKKEIKDWLYVNTEGRFYVGSVLLPDRSIKYGIGFELASEATMFALQSDTIQITNY